MNSFCFGPPSLYGERNLVTDLPEMPAKTGGASERGEMPLRSASISSSAGLVDVGNGTSQHRLADLSLRGSVRENHDLREVKINNIVGNGISGILHKWVNYGKGWRPRWFVLQDGVLLYFKIYGPHRIEVNQEMEKESKIIGEESVRWISKRKNHNHLHRQNNHNQNVDSQTRRKPIGEVHLKVSSIKETKSDDKRFSVFTGTKRLHLRAETREDRAAWVEALQAIKEMFPRISNGELMAPVESVSTEKLRQRLLDEGVNGTAIVDCEEIMRTEFLTVQNQLVLLQQKQSLLVDTLRQLERAV